MCTHDRDKRCGRSATHEVVHLAAFSVGAHTYRKVCMLLLIQALAGDVGQHELHKSVLRKYYRAAPNYPVGAARTATQLEPPDLNQHKMEPCRKLKGPADMSCGIEAPLQEVQSNGRPVTPLVPPSQCGDRIEWDAVIDSPL